MHSLADGRSCRCHGSHYVSPRPRPADRVLRTVVHEGKTLPKDRRTRWVTRGWAS
ncbi:hypothetical protein MINT15_05940 [Saccharomonospora viridis]|uniref:Uncharacterized protein n=1 Tax=Saccharomonospora viridis TaxID=1852 RepID=A0A837DCQ5_9PSEU|nr:hypothetical protein MINT15_05940 [Saccharomonospora viridis]